jgi:hypothetical protein
MKGGTLPVRSFIQTAASSCNKMNAKDAVARDWMRPTIHRRLRAKRARSWLAALFTTLVFGGLMPSLALRANAQDMGSSGDSMMMPPPGGEPTPDSSMAPPMEPMRITRPITGSMAVSPPYGSAPLRVGFFVLASDPEDIGFLTYSWNFGDGTVSSLPPELYIFHTYQNPGTYVCILTIKTTDGRSKTFVQGVDVQPPA